MAIEYEGRPVNLRSGCIRSKMYYLDAKVLTAEDLFRNHRQVYERTSKDLLSRWLIDREGNLRMMDYGAEICALPPRST